MRELGMLVTLGLFAVVVGCGSSSSTGGTGGNTAGTGTASAGGSSRGTNATPGGGSSGGTSTISAGGCVCAGTTATGVSGGGTVGTAAGGDGGSTGATAIGGSGGDTGTTSSGTCLCGGASSCILPSCLQNLGADCVESGNCAMQTDLDTGNSTTCYANGITEVRTVDSTTGDRTMTLEKGSSICFSTAYNGNDVYSYSAPITVIDASGATVAKVALDSSGLFYTVSCTGGQPVALVPSCSNVWPVSVLMGSSCDEGGCPL